MFHRVARLLSKVELFVSNLPPTATAEHLKPVLPESAGIKMKKLYCFITVEEKDNPDKIVEALKGLTIEGNLLRVKINTIKKDQNKGETGYQGSMPDNKKNFSPSNTERSGDRGDYKRSFNPSNPERSGDRGEYKKDFSPSNTERSGDRDDYKRRFNPSNNERSDDRVDYKKNFNNERGADRGEYKKSFNHEKNGDIVDYKKSFDNERGGDRGEFKKSFSHEKNGDRVDYKKSFDNGRSGDRGDYKKSFNNERIGDRGDYKKRFSYSNNGRNEGEDIQEDRKNSSVEKTGGTLETETNFDRNKSQNFTNRGNQNSRSPQVSNKNQKPGSQSFSKMAMKIKKPYETKEDFPYRPDFSLSPRLKDQKF